MAQGYVWDASSSSWKPFSAPYVWDATSGTYKAWQNAWVWDATSGSYKQFYTAMTVSGVPSSKSLNTGVSSYLLATNRTNDPVNGSVKYTITGGTAPYTHALTKLSGSSHAVVTIAGPSATTSDVVAALDAGGSGFVPLSGTFRLTVTDANGIGVSVDFSVTFN